MKTRLALLVCVSLLGCDNGSGPPVDAGRTYRDGAYENCVLPGTTGNDAGVGGYCEMASDCPTGTLCTGLFGAPSNDWFCSKLCSLDASVSPCGEGAMCIADPRGIACVPLICIGDAGSDAPTDAPLDVVGDVAGDVVGDASSD